MTTVTVSGFKIRKGERLYGTYVRYALYKATASLKVEDVKSPATSVQKAHSIDLMNRGIAMQCRLKIIVVRTPGLEG